MPDILPAEGPPYRQAIKIKPWARCVSGFLGAAGMGAGGAAVFITHVEAGPVALIAAGLVFGLVGLAGVMPTRLRVGDNEAEWWIHEVNERATAVIDGAVTSDAREVRDNLGKLQKLAPELASSIDGLVFLNLAYQLTAQAAFELGLRYAHYRLDDDAITVQIIEGGHSKALVQVNPTPGDAGFIGVRTVLSILDMAGRHGADRLLLLSNGALSEHFEDALEASLVGRRVRHATVSVTGREDLPAIEDALISLDL